MTHSFDVAAGLARVRRRIVAAGGDPDAITIVAVSKRHDASAIEAALAAGLVDVGENYAQELVEKVAFFDGRAQRPRWHFIGQLQTNKVRKIAGAVCLWHSVDRQSLGAEIARRSPGAEVLVQLNATDESQKGGCRLADAPALIEGLGATGLRVVGVMTMGAADSQSMTDDAFGTAVQFADDHGLPIRSMGMSGDLESAVRAGSTMLRIGTDLFGPRAEPPEVEH